MTINDVLGNLYPFIVGAIKDYVIETWTMWLSFIKEALKGVSSAILNNPRRVKHSVNGYEKK